MGTPEFSVPTLDILIKNKFNILKVYTQPPKKSKRGQKVNSTPVEEFCKKNKINFRNPLRIEIYDKKIESLRFFNSKTQLTSKKVDIATTLPAFEYPLNETGVLKFKKNWRNPIMKL